MIQLKEAQELTKIMIMTTTVLSDHQKETEFLLIKPINAEKKIENC